MTDSSRVRDLILVAAMVGGTAACSGNIAGPTDSVPMTPSVSTDGTDVWHLENTSVSMQALPNAVFRTVPAADDEDAIRGNNPLRVEFNSCQSRPTDEDDNLKYTFDFDNDGTVDEFGSCRAEHMFTRATTTRACVSDRRGNDVCKEWAIRPGTIDPEPQGPAVVIGNPPSATWTSISVNCTPLTTTVTMRVTDPDNDPVSWSVALTGGTLTSAPSGGPIPSNSLVTIHFTGTRGLNTVRLDLVDAKGVRSVPVTRFGPSGTCGGQTLQILG